MSTGEIFLNYLAFFILYVLSFIFLYIKNSEIIGYYALFVTNTACAIYMAMNFGQTEGTIPLGLIFLNVFMHSISLVFLVLTFMNLKQKFFNTFGTPIQLPPVYQNELDIVKRRMLYVFTLCTVSLFVLFNIVNSNANKEINVYSIVTMILPTYALYMTYNNLITANNFTVLSRTNLMN
jgi:hypothetical protein